MASSLFFTCPTTHQKAPAGIKTDVQSLQTSWKATLKVKCPHCGEVHQISVRKTYVNSKRIAPHGPSAPLKTRQRAFLSHAAAFSAACSITSERAKGFNHQPKILPQVKPCLGMAL